MISVIIPVYNSGKCIGECLRALFASSYASFEVIAVDGGSKDSTMEIARKHGAAVLQIPPEKGVAAARNLGAQHARGEILLFVDSDVVVRENTLTAVYENFHKRPEVDAVFGSYDDEPAEENFLSQYKNLIHHYHHQNANIEASTFWTGCGAIRKKVFEAVGGFDSVNFSGPSEDLNNWFRRLMGMEDIELGYRLRSKGYRIFLDKHLLVKHLKRWEFPLMLKTDIFQRAIPWSCLILGYNSLPNDLNLKTSEKISAVSLALLIIVLPFSFVNDVAGFISLIPLTAILLLNRKLYCFFFRKRGLVFALKVIPFHFLYYLYSGSSFVFCWIMHKTPFYKFVFRSSSSAAYPAKNL